MLRAESPQGNHTDVNHNASHACHILINFAFFYFCFIESMLMFDITNPDQHIGQILVTKHGASGK